MASLSNITLAVRANIDQFQKRLQVAEKRLTKMSRNFTRIGGNLSRNLSLPLAVAGGAAVKAAADFETAMVEVQKVTDETTADKLTKSIRRMSEEIPVAQNELAGLAADAARFGIRGVDNIQEFTRVAAMMGEATELASQQAGESLAKLATITDTPINKIENLGSSINSLSNTAGASADEIVQNMLKASKGLVSLGANNKEMAALAATVNETSDSAERAGTQMNRLASQLLNPRIVKKLSNAMGVSVERFKQIRDESPVGLMRQLATTFGEGGDKATEFRTILSEVSVKALAGLSQNLEGLDKNLKTANVEFEKGTSLQKEAETAFKTFNARLTMAINKLRNVGITIGNMLLPFVTAAIDKISKLLDWFKGLSTESKELSLKIAGVAAAIGPLLVAIGTLGPAMMKAARIMVTAAQFAAGGIKRALITTGIGVAVVAFGIAVQQIIKHWDKIKEAIMASGIPQAFGFIVDAAKDLVSSISDELNGVWRAFKDVFDSTIALLKPLMGSILKLSVGSIKLMVTLIKGNLATLKKAWEDNFLGMRTNVKIAVKFIEANLKAIDLIIRTLAVSVSKLNSLLPSMGKEAKKSGDSLPLGDMFSFQDVMANTSKKAEDSKEAFSGLNDMMEQYNEQVQKALQNSKNFQKSGGGKKEQTEVQRKELQMADTTVGMDKFQSAWAASKEKIDQTAKSFNKVKQGQKKAVSGFNGIMAAVDRTNEAMERHRQKQKEAIVKNRMLNETGRILGQTFQQFTGQISKAFAGLITGQKEAMGAFKNFGKFLQDMFTQLLQRMIQMVIQMLAMKAITAAFSGGTTMLSGFTQTGLGGFGQMAGNLMGGNSGGGNSKGQTEFVLQGDELRGLMNNSNATKSRRGG